MMVKTRAESPMVTFSRFEPSAFTGSLDSEAEKTQKKTCQLKGIKNIDCKKNRQTKSNLE